MKDLTISPKVYEKIENFIRVATENGLTKRVTNKIISTTLNQAKQLKLKSDEISGVFLALEKMIIKKTIK